MEKISKEWFQEKKVRSYFGSRYVGKYHDSPVEGAGSSGGRGILLAVVPRVIFSLISY